jgi:HEAT repeat protein
MTLPRALTLLGLFLLAGSAVAAPDSEALKADEKLLRENGITADDAGLLAFFRKRTPTDADLRDIERLVGQLGERSFARRNNAARALVERGPAALLALRKALQSRDIEVVRRAEQCIAEIERPGSALPVAAVRLLAARKPAPADALKALIGYAPFADDVTVEEEVLTALLALGGQARGQPDPTLLAALADPLAARRAAAAHVLGRHPQREQRAAVEKLLKDPSLTVRFRAGQALLFGREKAAVPALIDLLPEAAPEMRWQIEDLLTRLAGEQAPPDSATGEDAAALKKRREDWMTWWAKNNGAVNLARLEERPPFLNLTLVPEMHANKVWEFGPDGKVRWELKTDLQCPIDAQVLPGGRVLVAEINGHRVTERDRNGKILWEHKVNTPIACQRLPNGNTFISTNHVATVVTPAGKEVFSYRADNGFFIHSIQRLANGHLACISMGGVIREVDKAGKVVRDISLTNEGSSWSGIEGLPGNRFLAVGGGKVLEVDAAGKVGWKVNVPGACYATRLPNGNTLVVNNSKGLVEVDRTGKTVWERPISTNLWRVHRR